MKKINHIILLFFLLLFYNCETDSYELGDLINPSNLSVIADIQGQDNDNPFGDGSGYVTFTAVADGAISYKFTILKHSLWSQFVLLTISTYTGLG